MQITINDNGRVLISEDGVTVNEVTEVLFTALLGMYRSSAEKAENPEEATEHLYDYFNAMASSFLEAFAPEIELRPDLTTQAILEMENDILNRESEENASKE